MNIDIKALSSAFAQVSWGNGSETIEDLASILRRDDSVDRERLFKKFFLEGVSGAAIKALFDAEEIKSYLKGMKRHLARRNQEKRRRVWRHLYLGEHESIPELDWVIPKR